MVVEVVVVGSGVLERLSERVLRDEVVWVERAASSALTRFWMCSSRSEARVLSVCGTG